MVQSQLQEGCKAPVPVPGMCTDFPLHMVLAHMYVLQALWKYCPHYAVRGSALAGDEESGAESKCKEDKLTILQWTTAFDKFAMAAAVCPVDGANGVPMWEYSAAIAYRRVVFEVCRVHAYPCFYAMFCLSGCLRS